MRKRGRIVLFLDRLVLLSVAAQVSVRTGPHTSPGSCGGHTEVWAG